MRPTVSSIDHLVLTVTDLAATRAFYCDALGMIAEEFTPADGSKRSALKFGAQKINLHVAGAEFKPKAHRATPGPADLCFLSGQSLDEWQTHLASLEIKILEGPVARTGATGQILSIYIRDPDKNLIEISTVT